MKRLLFALLLAWCTIAAAQNEQPVSILDIAPNYGVPTAYIIDTSNFLQTMQQPTNDLIGRASFCVNISTRVQTMLLSLKQDYKRSDGKIWLDDNKALYDFDVYEENLQALAIIATRYSQHFMERELKRQQEAITQNEKQQQEEYRQLQRKRDSILEVLTDSVALLHDSISNICLRFSPNDRELGINRKDIYYAYLPIYNQIYNNVPSIDQLEEHIGEMTQLLEMQKHITSHDIGPNNYSKRIDDFQNTLKKAAGEQNIDIYRSYCRHFTHTSVPIAFRSVSSYKNYARQMDEIIEVQNGYLACIGLHSTVDSNTSIILQLYTKPYTDIANAYSHQLSMVNTIPGFNRIEECSAFIQNLKDFITIQEAYIANHPRLEKIRRRANDIIVNCPKNCADLRLAYQTLPTAETFVPNITDVDDLEAYNDELTNFEQVQQNFYTIVMLRDSIDKLERIITSRPNNEKVFIQGYKAVKEESAVSSTLATAAEVQECVDQLNSFIDKQQTCLKVAMRRDSVVAGDQTIELYKSQYPNIYATYVILRKDYQYTTTINSIADMQQYHVKLIETNNIQHRYLNILQSDKAASIDNNMRNLRDLTQIKNIFHL